MEKIGGNQLVKVQANLSSGQKIGVVARVIAARGRSLAVITEAPNKRYLGALLITRWEDVAGKFRSKPVRIIIKDGLYSELRRLWHIWEEQGQGWPEGEVDALQQIRAETRRVTSQLVGMDTEQFRRQIGWPVVAGELADFLGQQPRKEVKIRARRLLLSSQLAQDSLGRFNPTITRAKLGAVSRLTVSRYNELMAISSHLSSQWDAVTWLLRAAEQRLCYVLEEIYQWQDPAELRQMDKAARQQTAELLGSIADDLRIIDYNPFWVNFRLTARELDKAAEHLTDERYVKAAQYLGKCIRALFLKVIQREVERIIWRLTQAREREWRNLPSRELDKRIAWVKEALTQTNLSGFQTRKSIEKARTKLLPEAVRLLDLAEPMTLQLARDTFKEISRRL